MNRPRARCKNALTLLNGFCMIINKKNVFVGTPGKFRKFPPYKINAKKFKFNYFRETFPLILDITLTSLKLCQNFTYISVYKHQTT
jgi:hypothetical protein